MTQLRSLRKLEGWTKPRLFWNPALRKWVCWAHRRGVDVRGIGTTPLEAWADLIAWERRMPWLVR